MSVVDIINRTIGNEGGYVLNPNDRGGATRWGVTETVARKYGYTGRMQELPKETAVNIYLKQYWYEPQFNKIDTVSTKIAEEIFDTGVNTGPSVPAKHLQRLLNVFNRQQKDYPDLIVDGKVGTKTADALRTFLARRGSDGELQMLKGLNALQAAYYVEISEKREANEDFFYGWISNRVVI